jgi:hypothetical protein
MARSSRGIALALTGVLVWAGCRPSGGVALTVHNTGDQPLDSLVAVTTGGRYPLGTLAPGAARTVTVQARGESGVELEHGQGGRQRLVVQVYFERGYGGTIDVEVTADSVRAVHPKLEI